MTPKPPLSATSHVRSARSRANPESGLNPPGLQANSDGPRRFPTNRTRRHRQSDCLQPSKCRTATGQVAIDRLAQKLRVTKTVLAFASGLSRDAVATPLRLSARSTQSKLSDMLEILNQMLPWTGSAAKAFLCYRTRPLASFGGRTAEDLVKEGRAEAVKAYFSLFRG